MLTQSRQTRTRIQMLCDGALFALSLVLVYLLRDGLAQIEMFGAFSLQPLEPLSELVWLLPCAAILGPLFLSGRGFYTLAPSTTASGAARKSSASRFFAALCAAALTALALIILLFLVRVQIARSVVMLGCALGSLFACARAALTDRLFATRLAREQWRQRVVWIGDSEQNDRHRAALSPDEKRHIADLGNFDPRAQTSAQFTAFLHEHAVDLAIFNLASPGTHSDIATLQPFLDCCTREGVSLAIRTGFQSATPALRYAQIDSLGGEAVIHHKSHAATEGDLAIKRTCDIIVSALSLIVLSPLFLIIALAIKLTSRGPILFRQTRVGLNGRLFSMLKFRTMRLGAENEQTALARQNEMQGPVFKIADDPRLTALGRFLRRHSLDEFPQLWNVLRGEMSLVGPRPLPDYEVKKFDDNAHRRRQSVRPGLTCLWQVSGRNDIDDFAEWVRLDLAYIDNWSLWLDARIIFSTIPVVIFGKGGR